MTKTLTPFAPRSFIELTLFISVCVLLCLLVGAFRPGNSVAAFTANPARTREVWVMDSNRHLARRIEVFGHKQEVAVWSNEISWFVFYSRSS
ncbi:MAG: hypothetical protein R3E39_31150 [Anaerolineae bacterium]